MKAAFALVLFAAMITAAPAPPQTIVNNATMECSAFNAGDECTRCEIPDGWVSLGYGAVACPEGYAEISAARNCTPGRNARCCSEGHSGAMGNCSTVIVNNYERACAFFDDYACQIAPGWTNAPLGSGQCPSGYVWEKSPCTSAGGNTCAFPAAMLIVTVALAFIKTEMRLWE